MKTKKYFLSLVMVLLLSVLVISGAAEGIKKKPIVVDKMASAYEEVEESNEAVDYNEGQNFNENEEESSPTIIYGDEGEDKVCICVYGNGKVSAKPDRAKVSAQIEMFDVDMLSSRDKTMELFNNIVKALKKSGVEEKDICFESYYSYPKHDYDSLLGYMSYASFSVNADKLSSVKEITETLAENGVKKICDVVYEVSNMEELYGDALNLAIDNAKAKAEKILESSELQVVSIKEECVYCCNSLYRNYAEDMIDYIGEIEIEARVLVELCK